MRLAIAVAALGLLVGAPGFAPTNVMPQAQAALQASTLTLADGIAKAAVAGGNVSGNIQALIDNFTGTPNQLALALASAAASIAATNPAAAASVMVRAVAAAANASSAVQVTVGVTASTVAATVSATNPRAAATVTNAVDSAGGSVEGAYNAAPTTTSGSAPPTENLTNNATAVSQTQVNAAATNVQSVVDRASLAPSTPPGIPPRFDVSVIVVEPNPAQSGSPTTR